MQDLVLGADQRGCGFESQLESMYRSLVDPTPYGQLVIEDERAVAKGSDVTLLQQRADFLRPDSAVVIVLLTDENDCSTREGGQYFLSNQGGQLNGSKKPFHLPRARSTCVIDPEDPCCASCGQPAPPGCPVDPACADPTLSDAEDPINLRCFDQKRRFGIDFLYPIDRYVRGLGEPSVAARDGSVVPNPLFAGGRGPELVIFGGIVGVPWQDLAADPQSLSAGFAPPDEIDWGLVIGDPEARVPPGDPLMIESVAPRSGVSPLLEFALAPPSAGFGENPINGHERVIPGGDDLQYACIYPRPTPKDCAAGACECEGADIATNPICQQPDGSYSSVQRAARALPGIRELQLVKALGRRAAAGSVCAPITAGPQHPTFGFKPSVDAVLRALRPRIE
jgi:hypothetical protein